MSSSCAQRLFFYYRNSQLDPDFGKLVLCIVIDVIGTSSELIPFVGELTDIAWAPLAAIALRSLYGSNIVFVLEFVEEILPFTDILPLATLWYVHGFLFLLFVIICCKTPIHLSSIMCFYFLF